MTTVYIYHYCAMVFHPNGDKQYITGIATYEDPILDYASYTDLTDNLEYTHEVKNVTIISLSLLGTKEKEDE